MRAFVRLSSLGLLGVLWFASGPGAVSQEATPPPIVRVLLLTEQPVMVSQPAELAVEVLVPTFLRGSPGFPDALEIPDAVVLLRAGSSLNLNERIDGESWAGLRRTYTVFPTRSGTIEVPAIPLRVPYQRPEEGFDAPPFETASDPISFEAFLPAEASGEPEFLASRQLTLTQRWEPQIADASGDVVESGESEVVTVKVGEALTRTVTMRVAETPAMFLPSLGFPVCEGVRAYPSQPVVSDTGGERGEARVGERLERVTYAFEQEGECVLPEIEVTWWNLASGRLERSRVPAPRLSISADLELDADQLARLEQEEGLDASAPGLGRWGVLLGGAAALALAWLALRRPLRRWLEERRQARVTRRETRKESENAAFEHLLGAVRSGEESEVLSAWMQWLDRREDASPGAATLSGFVDEVGDESLRQEADALVAELYGGGAERDWSRHGLERALVRSRAPSVSRRRQGGPLSSLPELNPATRTAPSS